MKHRERSCWCGESHNASVLPLINGEESEAERPVQHITIVDPSGIHPASARHEIRFTTVFSEHSAQHNVIHLTDKELDNLYYAITHRVMTVR